jgi:hypothetical protein
MAAICVADKFKLVDMPSPTMEAAMLNAFAASPTPNAVTVVAKAQRAPTAPKQEDLFRLLKGRLAPVKLDAEWFRGGNGMISKAFANILENPDAQVIYWDMAQYTLWATEAEAKCKAKQENEQAERKAQEQAHAEAEAKAKAKEEGRRKYKHGYVYAFHFRNPKGASWIKVGMTSSDDEAACWGRINGYIKAHNLPSKGWEFVGFVARVEAYALEKRLRQRMHKFRFVQGSARELFRCSLSVYLGMLDAEDEFIKEHAPDTADEEIERAKQADAKRQAQRDREQQAKEKAEREARERAEHERIEREAREKAVREARAKAERERVEREAREIHERAELEAREKAKREAHQKAEHERIEREAREHAVREARAKAERERVELETLEGQKQNEALAQAKREREAREIRERAEHEAREKAEREARQKAEHERIGRETREKAVREARAKAERERLELETLERKKQS